jgi:predicted acetyltransferase
MPAFATLERYKVATKFHAFTKREYYQYRFPNGYGASVIPDFLKANEGKWELAVLKFNSPSPKDFDLCYETDVTDDVFVSQTEDEILAICDRIKFLPSR